MTELKMADIYSSYLDEINALRKENKRLRKQLKTAKIKPIGNKFLDDLTDQDCDALAAAYGCERR